MRSIQSIAAQARRECDLNGLPCGDYIYQDKPQKITEEWSKADTAKWGSIDKYNEWYAQNERRLEATIPNLMKFAQALNELPERQRCCPLFGKFKGDHAKIRELMDADPSRFNAKVVYELDNFEELYK